jgi:PKD domain-containing protein/Big-like domain-containing protein
MRRVIAVLSSAAVMLGAAVWGVLLTPVSALAACPVSGCGGGGGGTYPTTLTVTRVAAVSSGTPTTDVGYVKSDESTPAIDCGTACSFSYDTDGTNVEPVTAYPLNGWTFSSWSGCASVSGATCTPAGDAADNVTATFVDTSAPSLALSSPPAAGTHVRSVSLTATDSDNDRVKTLQWLVKAGGSQVSNGSPLNSPGGTVAHTFDLSGLSDGTYTFGVQATDYSNNVSFRGVSLVLDRTVNAPTVTSPVENGWVPTTQPQLVFGGVDSDAQAYCSTSAASTLVACTSPWAAPEPLPQGANQMSVRAIDGAGNFASRTIDVNVDSVHPSAAFAAAAPADNAVTSDSTPTYDFTFDGTGSLASAECHADTDAPVGCYTDGTSGTFTTPVLAEGTHTVHVVVVDQAGNATPMTRTVKVDLTDPVVALTGGPADGATVTVDHATYGYAATDDNLGTVTCAVDAVVTACDSGSLPVTGLTPGAHTVTVSAIDQAGNASSVSRQITYTPPAASFIESATSVAPGAPVSFDASASSSPAGVQSYAWDFGDGTSATGMTVSHVYSSTGAFVPTLTIHDGAGAQATKAGAPVTVRFRSSLSFARQSTLRYGSSRSLHATLAVGGASAVGRQVTLLARPAGARTWSNVATVTTRTGGVASVSVHPRATTAYRWTYAGDDATFSTGSSSRTVAVAYVVTASLTKTHIGLGATTTLWGTVRPSSAGQRVTVQRKSGRHWLSVATVRLAKQRLPSGRRGVGFVYRYRGGHRGTVVLRVVRASTSTLAQGISSARTLRVG